MTAITQNENRWEITGDINMDSANMLLVKSKVLTIPEKTVIDFAQVAEVDTSAVSLMLEWQRRAIAENKQLKFVNLPDGLTSLAELYDITDLIN